MEIDGSPEQNALRSRWTLLGVAALACVLIAAIAFGAPIQTVVGLVLVTPILTGVVGAALGSRRGQHRGGPQSEARSRSRLP
jgi:fatty acid desaturase